MQFGQTTNLLCANKIKLSYGNLDTMPTSHALSMAAHSMPLCTYSVSSIRIFTIGNMVGHSQKKLYPEISIGCNQDAVIDYE